MLLLESKAYLPLPVCSLKKGIVYLHKSLVPLPTVKLPSEAAHSFPGDTDAFSAHGRLFWCQIWAEFSGNCEGINVGLDKYLYNNRTFFLLTGIYMYNITI